MTIKIIDLNKKFYSYQKDLVLLEKIDAIREAIKNTIAISESDIPMNNISANIDYFQLQYLTHYNASQLVSSVELALKKIDFVKSAIIKFHYLTPEKKLEVKVTLENVNEDVVYNLDLA